MDESSKMTSAWKFDDQQSGLDLNAFLHSSWSIGDSFTSDSCQNCHWWSWQNHSFEKLFFFDRQAFMKSESNSNGTAMSATVYSQSMFVKYIGCCIHPNLISQLAWTTRTNVGPLTRWSKYLQLVESWTPRTLGLPHLPTFERGAGATLQRWHKPKWYWIGPELWTHSSL